MKDEGFFSPAGKRFVLFATVLILGGVLAYFVLSEEISIDLEELTGTTTTSSTAAIDVEVPEVTVPEVTVPEVAKDPYIRCISQAETAEEIFACDEG